MTVRIAVVETPAYLAKAEHIMGEEERWVVVDMVSLNPLGGVLIRGSGGLRKMRIALEGRGKRGGGRVIYWFHSPRFPAVLLWAFAKTRRRI
ncbi:MAG: addiction module toxin RelE [Rhizobiales bacterium]|nr:addiction module toxin RelE [Hyphomicrobiales bacterium]